jgi:hypothetical protein
LLAWAGAICTQIMCSTLSTCASDHAPLLLHTDLAASGKQRFCFESKWPRFPSYLEAVVDGWQGASTQADPF